MKDEFEQLQDAQKVLGLEDNGSIIKRVAGRRVIAQYGCVIIKSFSVDEINAWNRELSALQAIQSYSFAPKLLEKGERWIAIRKEEGIPAIQLNCNRKGLHSQLGSLLKEIHKLEPNGMQTWSLEERLVEALVNSSREIPFSIIKSISNLTEKWSFALRDDGFVHGDWGLSNVLVNNHSLCDSMIVIDFEDSHIGDPAEDFRWQALAGPNSNQLSDMLSGYGNTLGLHASERISLATAELSLNVLGWAQQGSKWQDQSYSTLKALADGWLPEI